MATGYGDVLVLYTKDGQPVDVQLADGEYRLSVRDPRGDRKLDEIRLVLMEIRDLLAAKKG